MAVAGLLLASCIDSTNANAMPAERPWMDEAKSPDERAALVLREMTDEEKLRWVFGYFGASVRSKGFTRPPQARPGSAGFVEGVPRLGIPHLWETDAGLGVASSSEGRRPLGYTSLASGLATAATWNPALAFRSGAMIGSEARESGFNVMLAGAVNLAREPRNGRNFEYAGEDPLLAGIMVGEQVRGIQSAHLIATVKHFALNDQETGRRFVNAEIAEDQARMSDLLAFQLAIEHGDPGAVMCAYNRVNTVYACENPWLLNDVLKRDWHYRGWVMSDWGAMHSTARAANAGLDQESGAVFDSERYFEAPLREALKDGTVSRRRLDDMVRRILRSMFAKGVVDDPVAENDSAIDLAAHASITQAGAQEGAVLLKNSTHLLPIDVTDANTIAVIGSHADAGVLSGGGASQVYPSGGPAVAGLEPRKFPGPVVYFPDSPLRAMQKLAPGAVIRYDSGDRIESAVKLAAASRIVVLFAHQWSTETLDTSLTLSEGQDQLISAVARANPNTVVVLETGGPVLMPWIDEVSAVLEAWYPGTRGGHAIAGLLFGRVAPSGRLPISFPRSLQDLPHPVLDGVGLGPEESFSVTYSEGAAVGYKWFDSRKRQPLFPFGHGLTYTRFEYSHLKVARSGGAITVSFDVTNSGATAGKDVPQVYLGPPEDAWASRGWEAPKRLAGWQKVDLEPGAREHVSVSVDSRLLSVWDSNSHHWRVVPGSYRVMLGGSAGDIRETLKVRLPL